MVKNRYHFESIDSTNKKAKELAEAGCEHATLVTADAQEAGVGRRGRNWSSEKGAGIYMSMVLRPNLDTTEASMLTIIAALAVAKAIQKELEDKSIVPYIKWPNDIVINKKKVCGILTELSLKGSEIDYIVVGIGINVTNISFPEEISQTASSIFVESKQRIDREQLITSVWKYFEQYFDVFIETKDLQFIRKEYEELLANKDKEVKVLDPKGEYEGIARGITNKGELLVETEGKIQQVSSGEVSVRGIYGYV